MRNLFFAGIFAFTCGTLAAQPPAVPTNLHPAPSAQQPLPLSNPQIRPVPTITGTPVYRNPASPPLVTAGFWENNPPLTNSNPYSPWRMRVQNANWNPMLPAGWNPNMPATANTPVPNGWNANANPGSESNSQGSMERILSLRAVFSGR